MKVLKAKIVHDTKIGVFYQSESKTAVKYPEDEGSPLLKRLAPRRPPLNPAPPEEDDNTTPAKQDES
ncbi:MAG: hypothetical protein OXG84_18745 [Chloroflexi bacterium]|nr:hypothetical protein [Chloroflexota bacterium]